MKYYVTRAPLGKLWIVATGSPHYQGCSSLTCEGFRHWNDAMAEANRRAEPHREKQCRINAIRAKEEDRAGAS